MDFSRLTSYLDSLPRLMGVPGCHMIIHKHGKPIYDHIVGYADRENGIEMKGNEIFNMYSCSKIVTCTLALTLFEQGKYNMDDLVSKYFPEYADIKIREMDGCSARPISKLLTVRHLFTMTGGINYSRQRPALLKVQRDNGGKPTTRQVIKAFTEDVWECDPGDKFIYSYCHDILAGLVEIWAGKPFDEYAREVIFDPLGMTTATYDYHKADFSRFAQQYEFDFNDNVAKPIGRDNNEFRFGEDYISGGAGLMCSAEDYIKFMDALIGGKIISPITLKMMTTSQHTKAQAETTKSSYCFWGYSYGLGVAVLDNPGESDNNAPIGTFGWSGAAGSMPRMQAEQGISVLYCQHMKYGFAQGVFEPRLINIAFSCIEEE